VEGIIRALSLRRPIFHSEADFQHELAWEIHRHDPTLGVRLEVPFPGRASGAIDIMLMDGAAWHALELKYLSRSCHAVVGGEEFNLKQQGAQDVRRYDVCKDVARMEEFSGRAYCAASVIVLSNDPAYWEGGSRIGTCAEAFAIPEGRTLAGGLDWAPHTGAGTKKAREAALHIRGPHHLAWRDYSAIGNPRGRFRYLHIPIRALP
jgi:hypothetical protein